MTYQWGLVESYLWLIYMMDCCHQAVVRNYVVDEYLLTKLKMSLTNGERKRRTSCKWRG